MSKLDPQRLIFGAYLLIPIVAMELICGHFQLPAWPAFLAMIFLFVEHMDFKKVPQILVGGLFGIASIIGAKVFITALAPSFGLEAATIAFVVLIVYAIVALGEMVPMVFNNYMFMYLTVAGIAAKTPEPNPFLWMAIEVVGGGALIGSVLAIAKLMAAQASQGAQLAAETAPATEHGKHG